MRVLIRVRPTKGNKMLSSRDAAPFAPIVGKVGNAWCERELTAAQLETLSASGVFEFRSATAADRKARVVRLVERDNTRNVVKLTA